MFLCLDCGSVLDDELNFCSRCGSTRKLEMNEDETNEIKSEKNLFMCALVFALIPGIFNIFGLGQFILGRRMRGLFFFCISVAYYTYSFMYDFAGYGFAIQCIMFIAFCIQSLDVYLAVKSFLGNSDYF